MSHTERGSTSGGGEKAPGHQDSRLGSYAPTPPSLPRSCALGAGGRMPGASRGQGSQGLLLACGVPAPPTAPLPAPSERSPLFQEEPAQQSRGARCSSNRRQRLVTKEVLLCTQIPPGKRMEVAIWLRLASQSSTHTQAELPRSHFHDNHMKC